MLQSNTSNKMAYSSQAGFTLIEMLVSVALVLLMMTMFAEIFTIATGSMSKQKALSELDQRQRLVSTLVRKDLQDRTFQYVYAFHRDDNFPYSQSQNKPINIDSQLRRGYIAISENDPDNDSDDSLQLTVQRTGGTLYGRTKELRDTASNGVGVNPNQPENDDNDLADGYGFGSSDFAEITYFLRSGTLYRRVSLIRPTPTTATWLDNPATGATGDGANLFQIGIYPVGSGMGGTNYIVGPAPITTFPRDFDYSASYNFGVGRIEIHGQESLDNSTTTNLFSLGIPNQRFGFTPTGTGAPLEYIGATYIGRFTHEETSHPSFAYPGDPGWGGDGIIGNADDTNPYTRTGLTAPLGIVTQYQGGARQGEDILLTNVQSFDIKVWERIATNGTFVGNRFVDTTVPNGQFVDIGHSGVGEYSQSNNQNAAYGPNAANNRCFDTWHPALPVTGPPLTNIAPFRPTDPRINVADGLPAGYGFDRLPGKASVDDDLDGTIDNSTELGWPDSDDLPSRMEAIQIRIRYLDISSGIVRDLTIVEPFALKD